MIKNILNLINKETMREALLLGSFALLLFTNQISNYTLSSYIIKSLSLIIAGLALYYYDKKNPQFIRLIKSIPGQYYLIGLFILIIYPAITLIYSLNPLHGFLKIVNMLVSNFPLLFFFYYSIATFSTLRGRVLVSGALVTGIIFSLVVIIFYPFNHYELYKFEPDRLSHVMVGRILGLAYIIILLGFSFENRVTAVIYGLILTIIGYASYLTALRASVIGLVICVLLYIFLLFRYKKSWYKAGVIISSVILTILMIGFTTKIVSPMPEERFGSFEKLNTGKEDGAIKARYYLYNRAIELIQDNPLWGVGFGGYAKKGDKFAIYPHNIFLEAYSELGAFGGTLIVWLIILALYRSYKYDRRIFILFIYALILAMFSKDLTTNGIVLMMLSEIICNPSSST